MSLFGPKQATGADILEALKKIIDPDLKKDIVALGFVKDAKVEGDRASCTIELTTPACPVKDQMKADAEKLLLGLHGVKHADVKMTAQVRTMASPSGQRLVPKVKNIVAIASGKGGVGKSTVSANLALALAASGAKVGLMDADVFGPSIPTILGITDKPLQVEGRLVPVLKYGVKVISMGFFVPKHEAVIWRGPMLHKMIQDFLSVVDWGELDYLLVDLPPGTGDVQLSLCQTVPLTGAVIVSTPQDVAWNIAQKAILMFDKLNAPILGIVENMSYFKCGHCGGHEEIFGTGGARKAAARLGIPFLGEVPLLTTVRLTADQGDPVVHSDPAGEAAKAFVKITENLAAQVSIKIMGGDAKPVPSKISGLNTQRLEIEWSDGGKSSIAARELRLGCPCAACVNEMTGERILNATSIRPDIAPAATHTVGRYALQVVWNDGHDTGLYGYDYLRKLAFGDAARTN
jgi:ATP-binding protein involved in chromosome partitioning